MLTSDLIELPAVMYDIRAKDGTWCSLPYPGHKKGCPNFAKGCTKIPDWKDVFDPQLGEQSNSSGTDWITHKWYAVIEEFDLEKHAEKMKLKHPTWSKKQRECVLYWQPTVKMKLRAKAEKYKKQLSTRPDGFCFDWACSIVEIPESRGVNVFGTMAKAGIILYKNPKIVRKIALIGIQVLTPQEPPVITPETPDCIWPYYRHNKRRCVFGKCACATHRTYFERVMPTCQYKRPSLAKEVAYAVEHGFDCILKCETCGKLEYVLFKDLPTRCHPDHPKCCNDLMRIIWLGSENQQTVANKKTESEK
jgi:hypothetical protein